MLASSPALAETVGTPATLAEFAPCGESEGAPPSVVQLLRSEIEIARVPRMTNIRFIPSTLQRSAS